MSFDSDSMSTYESSSIWGSGDSSSEESYSSEDLYSSPSEDDDTLDSEGQRNAKTLSDLSRSVVSQNVKRENVGRLPLPRRLKNEIFKNLLTDRHGSQAKVYGRGSFPCESNCSSFCSETRKSEWNKFPRWSHHAKFSCGVNLLYDELAFPSDAPWLKLPDRERLLRDLKGPKDERIALLNPLRFDRRSGLGDFHVWLKRFLFYESRYDWFFLVVAAGCMKSFARVAELVDLVVLPYWCVSDHGTRFDEAERFRFTEHRRCMIVVVRDGDRFRELLKERLKFSTLPYSIRLAARLYHRVDLSIENSDKCHCTKISKVTQLVKAIAYVSRPKREDSTCYEERPEQLVFEAFPETHYYIANPVVRHAEWWMLLMVGGFDELVRNRLHSKSKASLSFGKKIGGRRHVSAAVELNVEKCPVRFDPPDTCIGDPVPESELLDYVRSGKPFVFGFDRRILSTFRTDECPTDLPAYKEWCVSNEINTLLHFDRNDIVECRRREKKLQEPRLLKWFLHPFQSPRYHQGFMRYQLGLLED